MAQANAGRLAAVAGASASSSSAELRRASVEPDLSRMRKMRIQETPEERKKRLMAKTVNFTATIIARLIIIAGALLYAYEHYRMTGAIHRGIAAGVFAMFLDLGRVSMKAMEPGSK